MSTAQKTANSRPTNAMTAQLTAPSRMLSTVLSPRYDPIRALMSVVISRIRDTLRGSLGQVGDLGGERTLLDQQQGRIEDHDQHAHDDRGDRGDHRSDERAGG